MIISPYDVINVIRVAWIHFLPFSFAVCVECLGNYTEEEMNEALFFLAIIMLLFVVVCSCQMYQRAMWECTGNKGRRPMPMAPYPRDLRHIYIMWSKKASRVKKEKEWVTKIPEIRFQTRNLTPGKKNSNIPYTQFSSVSHSWAFVACLNFLWRQTSLITRLYRTKSKLKWKSQTSGRESFISRQYDAGSFFEMFFEEIEKNSSGPDTRTYSEKVLTPYLQDIDTIFSHLFPVRGVTAAAAATITTTICVLYTTHSSCSEIRAAIDTNTGWHVEEDT